MFGANTDSELRGDYSRARADFTVEQSWHRYTDADRALWRRLWARQAQLCGAFASAEFREGLRRIEAADAIPDLERVSDQLQRRTGWRIVAVPGFIPDDAFFRHLAARRFPVTVWLRKPEEFDYLVEPDIFHDFFGHVPMLFQPRFADFVQLYGEQGLKALRARALPMLSRVYWYTVEFGLIEGAEGLRAFGAGILSSGGETPYAIRDPKPQRIRFDMERCMRTLYRIDDYQKTYFVVRSMDELARAMAGDLAPVMERVRALPELEPGRLYPGDVAVPAASAAPRAAA